MKLILTTLAAICIICTVKGQVTAHVLYSKGSYNIPVSLDTFYHLKVKNETLLIEDLKGIKFISIMGRVYRITAPTLEEVKPEPVFNFPPWERRQYFPSQGIDTIRSGGIMLYNWPNKFYQL